MRSPEIATQVCTLCFLDGARVTAELRADSPYQDCPVTYSGALDRLPVALETASSVLLRAVFRSFARELRANFEEEVIGTWERYAEDGDELAPPPLASCQEAPL